MICPRCKKDVQFIGPITCPNTSRSTARDNLRSVPSCGTHSGCDHEHSGLLAEDVDLVETGWGCGCEGKLHLMMPFELWYPLGTGTAADPDHECVCGSAQKYAACCEKTHRKAFSQSGSYDESVRKVLSAQRDLPTVAGEPNTPCPCGSGKKFKNCCARRPCSCGKEGKKFGQCCGSTPGVKNQDRPWLRSERGKLRVFLKVYGENLGEMPVEECDHNHVSEDPGDGPAVLPKDLSGEEWLWCLHCERFFQAKDLSADFTGGRQGCAFEDCDGAGWKMDIFPWDSWNQDNDLPHWPKSAAELTKGQECPLYPESTEPKGGQKRKKGK